jgi:mannose-6-phosphate isomerase
MTVLAVDGALRHYDWGSRTAIPELLGIEPDGRPAAELWFGAHPHDPSPVDGSTLDRRIAADPVGLLGASVADRFDARLPYLLKVLAADRALSIQVHPNLEQAREGFAREETSGIAEDAPERNYKDPNHKPELLCALTPFDALCGFRPIESTLALLAELSVPELGFLADHLRGADPLRAAFSAVFEHPDIASVVAALTARVADADAGAGALYGTRLAADDAPGDVGVVLTLLLNYVRLEPGQAIYLGAGNVHAYLRGTGVEIMASSDNVLRCGLTPKHIDVPELLRITDFTPLPDPQWPSVGGRFEVPVPDFALSRIEVDDATGLHDDGPSLVLCTSGSVSVADVRLRPGHGAFVPSGEAVVMTGSGEVFVAGAGA